MNNLSTVPAVVMPAPSLGKNSSALLQTHYVCALLLIRNHSVGWYTALCYIFMRKYYAFKCIARHITVGFEYETLTISQIPQLFNLNFTYSN